MIRFRPLALHGRGRSHAFAPCLGLTLTFAMVACDPEPGDDDDDDHASTPADSSELQMRGACEIGTRVGGFEAVMDDKQTAISGEVADGVIPASVPKLAGEADGCRLLRKENPFCDPPCQAGTTCDYDGTCIAEPAPQDVGTVNVSGFVQPVSMTLPEGGYLYFDTSLPHPGFEPGAAMVLEASGQDQPAFTLYGRGVGPLTVTSAPPVIRSGEAVSVTWEPGGDTTEVRLRLNIDQHGNSPISLDCVTTDSGTFSMPAELLTELVDAGISGFPTLRIIRRTMDHVDLPDLSPGCVSFEVSTTVQQTPTIPGHTACKTDDDCPEGQVCDQATETCVDE